MQPQPSSRVQRILELIGELDAREQSELKRRVPKGVGTTSGGQKRAAEKQRVHNTHTSAIRCPSCNSEKIRPYGFWRGHQRLCCRRCSRIFNELSCSPLSGTHHPAKWRDFVECMVGGLSVRQTATQLDIANSTVFRWRHRLLEKYEPLATSVLEGIVETDETFFLFSEKGDKSVSTRREPRRRGGKAKKRGVSDEQVPVIAGCDRNGHVILGVAGRGRISMADVEDVLNNYIGAEITLCSDAHRSFKSYAKAYNLNYVGLNISKGQRIVKKKYHIQNVNNVHARLKQWMLRFNGVSTKYLQNYMNWFALLEETKRGSKPQGDEFAQRSVPSAL